MLLRVSNKKRYFDNLVKTTIFTKVIKTIYYTSIIGISFLILLLPSEGRSQEYLEMIRKGNYPFNEIKEKANAYFNEHGKSGKQFDRYKQWEWLAKRKLDDNGYLISAKQIYKERLKHKHTAKNPCNTTWSELGPFNWDHTTSWAPGVGRVICMAINPNNIDHIYVGSAAGGLWVTYNGGETWEIAVEGEDLMEIYSISIDPSNVNNIYFFARGGGVFRSTDGGLNWQNLVDDDRGTIRRILIDPSNSNTVLIGSWMGIWRSIDQGNTFFKVSDDGTESMEFNSSNSNIIYSAGTKFQRSFDNGNSWVEVSNGIVDNDRMKLAVTNNDPNYIYICQADGGQFGRLYKSSDGGNSFEITMEGTTQNLLGNQAHRDMAICVNHSNKNEVYVAGLNSYKSSDGGYHFSKITEWVNPENNIGYNHADVEALLFTDGVVFSASDGGIYKSSDLGDTWEDLSSGLGIRQFYRMGCSQTNPNLVIAGSQDNGTSIMKGNDHHWIDWIGGDGMESFFDYSNENKAYGSAQYGNLFKTSNQGLSYQDLNEPSPYQGSWVTPFEIDPFNSSTLYAAYEEVYKSTNEGGNWEAISDFNMNAVIDEMCVAGSNPKYIYISEEGQFWRTKNGGETWEEMFPPSIENINYIHVNPNDPERVAICSSSSVKVLESFDAGETWINITGSLPNVPANCLVYQNNEVNSLYLGMHGFIYYRDDNDLDWVSISNGFPSVSVMELEIVELSGTIRAATFGRGLWEAAVCSHEPPSDLDIGILTVDWPEDGEAICYSGVFQPELKIKNFGVHSVDYFSLMVLLDGNTIYDTIIDFNLNYLSVLDMALPSLTMNLANGEHELTVFTSLPNDSLDGALLNDTVVLHFNVADFVGPPDVIDATICEPGGNAVLQVVPSQGGSINWYANQYTSMSFLQNSEAYTTPYLTSDFTFYVEEVKSIEQSFHVGPSDNTFGNGGIHDGGYYLIFDAHSSFVLKSIWTEAQGAGFRNFMVWDNNGSQLYNESVFVPDGAGRVELNFFVPEGDDYLIGVSNGADLYRNNTNVNYPYEISDVVSITQSSALTDPYAYYYYLYDWEIETLSCISERVPIIAFVEPCVGIEEEHHYTAGQVQIFPNPSNGACTIILDSDLSLKGTMIRIINPLGKVVSRKIITQEKNHITHFIDLSGHAKGMYSIEITNGIFKEKRKFLLIE